MKFKNLSPLIFLISLFIGKAAPPFLTDDPEPVELHHIEVYLASQSSIYTNSGNGTLPHLEMNYGAMKDLHINIALPFGFSYVGKEFNYGLSDIGLGAKFRFIEETDNFPQVTTYPALTFPTGNSNKELGSGGFQLYIPFWFQKTFKDWLTYAGGGYGINFHDKHGDWQYYGWLVQKKMNETFTFGGELFYRATNAEESDMTVGVNVGGYINFSEMNHVIFSFGHSFLGKNTFVYYFGYMLTI